MNQHAAPGVVPGAANTKGHNQMKVDIIPTPGTSADWQVQPRDDSGEYEAAPVFGPASDCECVEWCDENGYEYRHRKNAALVVPRFFDDLAKRCDNVHAAMIERATRCGWSFASDCIYRASAAWKENPTHYAYNGDFGGAAYFRGVTDESAASEDGRRAQELLSWLLGAASCAWELGFNLTFDKAGKHRVFNTCPQWVTLEEEP